MELADIDLTIGNDKNNIARIIGVTPPEVAFLLRAHGHSSVSGIRNIRKGKSFNSIEERNRLRLRWAGAESFIEDMWMEFGGALPKTFKNLAQHSGLGDSLFATGPDRQPVIDPDDTRGNNAESLELDGPDPKPDDDGPSDDDPEDEDEDEDENKAA